ncbi:MAG: GAF domain-containing protein [Anaerolineae bacterium]|nr:GAF domain-containing protein [Anaerolineae bacterium]
MMSIQGMSRWERVKRFFSPPVFKDDEDKTRVASLLNTVLLTVLVLAVVFSLFSLTLVETSGIVVLLIVEGALVLSVLGSRFLMRSGRVRLASVLFSLTLWIIVTLVTAASGGVRTPGFGIYLVVVMIAGLLLGGRAGFAFAGLSALAGLAMLYAEVSGLLFEPAGANTPATAWGTLVASFVVGAATLNLATRSINAALARAQGYAAELETQHGQLENLVQERTRDLARRTSYLGATTTIAREVASVVDDPEQLFSRTADLISEQFGFYHTGLFLLDASGEWAELRAASSVGGRQMLARGHRLRVGEEGVVGYVAAHGHYRIALDVGQDVVFFNNPDLPGTRSEMALPLRARNEIIGVLDVQSTEPGAFSEEDVGVLQAVTDQLATAINSVRLFRRVQESMEAERRALGEMSREAWRSLLHAQPDLGYVSDAQGVGPAGDLWEPQMEQAFSNGQTTAREGSRDALSVPITVRDQVIGVVDGRKPDGTPWMADEIALWEAMAEQLNVALEGARLFRETQGRAAREQLTREIADRMRASINWDELMQTAVQEMATALGASRAFVQWAAPQVAGSEPSLDKEEQNG